MVHVRVGEPVTPPLYTSVYTNTWIEVLCAIGDTQEKYVYGLKGCVPSETYRKNISRSRDEML